MTTFDETTSAPTVPGVTTTPDRVGDAARAVAPAAGAVAARTREVGRKAAEGAGKAAKGSLRLMVIGLASAWPAYLDWRAVTEADADIDAARAAGSFDRVKDFQAQQRNEALHRTELAAAAARVGVAVLFGGWLLATLAHVAACGVAFAISREMKPNPQKFPEPKARAQVRFRHALAAALVSAALTFVDAAVLGVGWGVLPFTAHPAGFCWGWDRVFLAWPVAALVLVLLVLMKMAWNGTVADDLPILDVQRSTEPVKVNATEDRVVAALAAGVKVKPEAAATEVRIIGVPAKDARGVWTITAAQFETKGFGDLDDPEAMLRVARVLRRDRDWVFPERVPGDESQVRLYVADGNPWPEAPSPWPGLANLHHDAWKPMEIGTDLYKGSAFFMPPAQASELIGGSPGSGKTAFVRLGGLVVASDALSPDPGAEMDMWDAKDDGALAMFEPACTTYGAGDDDETARDLCEWLKWVRHNEGPRRKKIIKSLGHDMCPDGRLTRDLAHNPQVGLRLRVTWLDEVQDFLNHPIYGEDIKENLTYAAKQLRSSGWRFKFATQKPTSDAISTSIRSVLPVRVALRAEDYETSKATLGTGKLRADMLPDVQGAVIIRAAGDGASFRGHVKLRSHYVDLSQAAAHIQRLLSARPTGATAATHEPPRILTEIRRLIGEKGTDGRILTRELVPALVAYHLLDPALTEQERTEQLADLVRPYGVRSCADRAQSNAKAYWLDRVDSRGVQVGVGPALDREAKGSPHPHYGESPPRGPARSPGGSTARRGLHAV